MNWSLIIIFQAIILTSAISIDAFVASFAYGSNKIKIPFSSVQIINIVCSGVLGISLLIGTIARQYIPEGLTVFISFSVLLVLGLIKLLDGITKSIIRKYSNLNKELNFSLFNFKFILRLYADPEEADVDRSRTISGVEAVSLAIALSLDGLAVGFGAALASVNVIVIILTSLIITPVFILLGCYIGNKIARKVSFNLSWISGVILIVLAVLNLF